MTKTLKLYNCEAIIDDEDFEYLSKYNWGYDGRYVYAREYLGNNKYKKFYIHRLIMNTPKGMDTDHINGNKLDNRKENLRIATRSQNSMNQKLQVRQTTSKYKGVRLDKRNGRWVAAIKINGKAKHLGVFETEDLAAQAYNKAALECFGEFSKLN